ncbi:Retron-type reverse transcript ase [Pseudomonas syringae pv. primulae]|uniref:Retron-type reverse transcript ase n=1 Tax=Pseudomonas syringae pv. primulae TaxID=251707 RepID=A0A3M3Y752_9PSED|nr:Retron-type reverse transcript ase [Pseudomonas syringae pv. primulae]
MCQTEHEAGDVLSGVSVEHVAQLSRLGISKRGLARVSFHDGAWKAARHPAMHQALSNQCLRRYGLVTAQDLASAQR